MVPQEEVGPTPVGFSRMKKIPQQLAQQKRVGGTNLVDQMK
jgi:hypothetical protein